MVFEVVQLFVDWVKSYVMDLLFTDENLVCVVELVECLEGILLAIELVAVWIDMLGFKGLLVWLSERLDVLGLGGCDV